MYPSITKKGADYVDYVGTTVNNQPMYHLLFATPKKQSYVDTTGFASAVSNWRDPNGQKQGWLPRFPCCPLVECESCLTIQAICGTCRSNNLDLRVLYFRRLITGLTTLGNSHSRTITTFETLTLHHWLGCENTSFVSLSFPKTSHWVKSPSSKQDSQRTFALSTFPIELDMSEGSSLAGTFALQCFVFLHYYNWNDYEWLVYQ